MLKRLCLHIGVAKTGTKTLQLAMTLNGDLLRRHGFVYPVLPGHHHVGLALYAANESTSARLRARVGLADGDRMAEFVGEFPSRLAAAVTAADIHTAILSNEHCSSELSTVEAISRLHALLRDWRQSKCRTAASAAQGSSPLLLVSSNRRSNRRCDTRTRMRDL